MSGLTYSSIVGSSISGHSIMSGTTVQNSSIFTIDDCSGDNVLVVDADGGFKVNTDIIMKDEEHDEEWALSVSKGKLVIKPYNKKAKRRYNLNELLDDEDA